MKKYTKSDLKGLINKRVYKDELSDIYDVKIILANASRDTNNRSFGTLVFFDKEYTDDILNKVRNTGKPAIYIYNVKEDDGFGEVIYAE